MSYKEGRPVEPDSITPSKGACGSTIMETSTHTIFHLADIHIGSGGDRAAEYLAVFDRMFAQMRAWMTTQPTSHCLAVIAGDVFHHKTRYSGGDVELFHYLVDGITSMMDVVLIPGNHDTNVGDVGAAAGADLISPLTSARRSSAHAVHYWRKSGWYTAAGLDFYHLSVYGGGAPLGELQADPRAARAILLYHGMVNGAQLHIAIGDSKITRDFLQSWWVGLLGDIHRMQMITDTVAYPGSLIQQDVSEDRTKGLIVWTLGAPGVAPRHHFMTIDNPRGYFRFDARGGKSVDAIVEQLGNIAPANLNRIALITDASGVAAKQQVEELRRRFGRIDHVHNIAAADLNTGTDVIAALNVLLSEHKATDTQRAEIVRSYTEACGVPTVRRWKVLRMAWSGLFKYKEDNVIDFTRMPRLSGVIAPNRAGKSSLFDVMVLGLFGVLKRGTKQSCINNGSTEATITIDFMVNDERYRVWRSDRRTADRKSTEPPRACLRRLATHASGPVWIEITTGAVNVYAEVRKLIGSYETFATTGLYCSFSTDVTSMAGPTEQLNTLVTLFGLADTKELIKTVKSRLNKATAALAALPTPRGDPPGDIAAYTAELATVSAEQAQAAEQMAAIESEIKALTLQCGQRPRRVVSMALDRARVDLDNVNAACDEIVIEKDVPYAEAPASMSQRQLSEYARLRNATARDCREIETELAVARSQVVPGVRPVEALQAELAAAEQQLSHVIALPAATEQLDASAQGDPQRDLEAVEQRLAALVIRPTLPQGALQTMLARVERLKGSTTMRFNPACGCCKDNKVHLAADLATAEREYAAAKQQEDIDQQHNATVRQQMAELGAQRSALRATVAAHLKARESELQRYKLQAQIEQLRDGIKQSQAQSGVHQRIRALTAELDMARTVAAARAYYAAKYDYDQYTLRRRLVALQEQSEELQRTVTALGQELAAIDAAADSVERLAHLEEARGALAAAIAGLNVRRGVAETALAGAQRELAVYTTWAQQSPVLQEQRDLYDLYYKIVKGSHLKMAVVNGTINKVVDHCNHTLAFTGFSLRAATTETTIEFYINERDGSSVPIDLGSGFQRFIICIAFRLALASVVPCGCMSIFIDEGFGCMDAANIDHVLKVLPELSEAFEPMFIVSHLIELQNMLGSPLQIVSSVVNGAECSHISNVPVEAVARPPRDASAVAVTPAAAADAVDKVTCECGAAVSRRNLVPHRKTAKHHKRMETAGSALTTL